MNSVLQTKELLAKGISTAFPGKPICTSARFFNRSSLRGASLICAVSLVAMALLAVPALAQSTKGGDGGQGNASPSPLGGTSSLTGPGGNGSGTSESYEGAKNKGNAISQIMQP